MQNTKNIYFDLGASVGAVNAGSDPADLKYVRAKESVMNSVESAPFHRELCKIAVAAFEADDAGHTPAANLFRQLSTEKEWHREYNRFTDSVRRSLGAMNKEAAAILPAAAAAHDHIGGGVFKTLAAAGALGGTALGSLAFLLSRDARQSSAENAAILDKVREYKKLRRDIEEDMEHRGLMDGEVKE